ncbi:MAG: carbon storage regulator [Pirellulaceae bacterium]
MLVLTRKSQETIRIGENITISILKVKGRAVRIGIEAPGKVRVVRGELVTSKDDSREETDAMMEVENDAAAEKESQSDFVTSFAPQGKTSTQNVNRILAWRRNERRSNAPLAQAFRTAARSASWNQVRHLPIG